MDVKVTIRGSYFPGEEYDFSNEETKLTTFVEMLKNRGCYIAEDGHIRSKKGGNMSKLTRNGYWLTMATFNKKEYYFCEHRVVWAWHYGAIPKGKEINHKDYNRSNNRIENLELVTHSENMQHSRPNFNPPRGEKNGKAKLTDKQAKTIKTVAIMCGWNPKTIRSVLNLPMGEANIYRIINGKRYPHVVPADSILEVYPTIVDFTRNKEAGIEEELKNYLLGLNGEIGELTDLFKKMLYHGKEIYEADVLYELGDVLYYFTAICNLAGFDIYEVMMNNATKVISRYPNGFSCEASNNRIEDKAPTTIDGNGDNR